MPFAHLKAPLSLVYSWLPARVGSCGNAASFPPGRASGRGRPAFPRWPRPPQGPRPPHPLQSTVPATDGARLPRFRMCRSADWRDATGPHSPASPQVNPLQDRDGLCEQLYHYLWRKNANGQTCPGVNLPDTVRFRARSAALVDCRPDGPARSAYDVSESELFAACCLRDGGALPRRLFADWSRSPPSDCVQVPAARVLVLHVQVGPPGETCCLPDSLQLSLCSRLLHGPPYALTPLPLL